MLTPIADQLSTDYLLDGSVVLTVMWADLLYDIEHSTIKNCESFTTQGNRIAVTLRRSLIQATKDVNPRL